MKRKLSLFDYGASTWNTGDGRSSQNWFWKHYNELGFRFKRFQMWEVQKYAPKDLFKVVPKEVVPYYQYFNIPISSEVGNKFHPWTMIKLYQKQSDEYFSVKLDIDTPKVELPLVEQLGEDDEVIKLIDEFFFEHHTSIWSMFWWWGFNVQGTVADTYDIFLNLRKKGVRAHTWP